MNFPALNRKGQSTVIDIAMLSLIIIISLTFLQIYSMTHAATNTKNLKDQLMDEYAQHALLSLSYVSPTGVDYSTIQPQAVEDTYDKDLGKLVNVSLKLRNYTSRVDAVLQNWSNNVTAARNEIKNSIESMKSNISALRSDLQDSSDSLVSTLEGIDSDCEDTAQGLNSFGELIGGISVTEDSCDYITELSNTVTQTVNQADSELSNAESKLDEISYNVDSNAQAALNALQDARCMLREANVKIDYFISYAQLGVKEDADLLSIMPVTASIGSKTTTEIIGESLFIEDRLAESSYLGTAASAGVKLVLEGDDTLSDSQTRILGGAVLAYGRKNYLNLAQTAVENKFGVVLTKQGYAYCFVAQDCCSTIRAGECATIPHNSARAIRTINTLSNESAQMTLDIWRK